MAEIFLGKKKFQSTHFESPRNTKKCRPGNMDSSEIRTKTKILKPEGSGIIKVLNESKGQFRAEFLVRQSFKHEGIRQLFPDKQKELACFPTTLPSSSK